MTQDQWKKVDDYLSSLLIAPDDILEAALADSAQAGLPEIQITPGFGKLLMILASAIGARAILEIGTLGGYSAIWLARALPPGGRMITLESDPQHAQVARRNLKRAGLLEVVDVRLGPAKVTLSQLISEGAGPFDLVFIDADKPSYAAYLDWALKLTRSGSLIIADNIVRRGAVIDTDSPDANVQGVRRFNEKLAAEPRLTATVIQTVSAKGYDGIAIARVR